MPAARSASRGTQFESKRTSERAEGANEAPPSPARSQTRQMQPTDCVVGQKTWLEEAGLLLGPFEGEPSPGSGRRASVIDARPGSSRRAARRSCECLIFHFLPYPSLPGWPPATHHAASYSSSPRPGGAPECADPSECCRSGLMRIAPPAPGQIIKHELYPKRRAMKTYVLRPSGGGRKRRALKMIIIKKSRLDV